jgi:hypothetical protein
LPLLCFSTQRRLYVPPRTRGYVKEPVEIGEGGPRTRFLIRKLAKPDNYKHRYYWIRIENGWAKGRYITVDFSWFKKKVPKFLKKLLKRYYIVVKRNKKTPNDFFTFQED